MSSFRYTRVLFDHERLGDLGVGVSTRDEAEHVAFAFFVFPLAALP